MCRSIDRPDAGERRMLWCEDYLFVHYPKTAGKTLTRFFVQAWPRPIAGYISRGQVNELADCELEKTGILVGRGHENLSRSFEIVAEAGADAHAMKAIFCCIRNPYDLMVSNYHFMKETFKANSDRPNFIIANENDFVDYCEMVGVTSPRNWMTVDGKQPDNLQIIRFEHMQADLARYSEKFGFVMPELGHLNASSRAHYSEYMCERSERAIAEKFSYWFDEGYYEREMFGETGRLKTA